MSPAKYPIRRSQLIAPFGVGAMNVVKGGVSLICAGLDHWYKRENENTSKLDEDEFKFEEYRLEKLLEVNHFRLPPDFREMRKKSDIPNTNLGIPFLRFPQWHVCPDCNLMKFLPLNFKATPYCEPCRESGKKYRIMTQMPFIAMCEDGHLQYVPWNEYVHSSEKPECNNKLKYKSSGGAALAAQKIVCEKCEKERSLGGITRIYPSGETHLSKNLTADEEIFYCQGKRPWLSETDGENCLANLRVNLRGATNVWFGQTHSAIYIPQTSEICPPELVEFIRQPETFKKIEKLRQMTNDNLKTEDLRDFFKIQLSDYTDQQIEEVLRISFDRDDEDEIEAIINENEDTAFRRVEYEVLRQEQNEDLLITKSVPLGQYDEKIEKLFSNIMLVHKLRETRAFGGFTRIHSENTQKLAERKKLLRQENLPEAEDWLPATIVFGEGLFFELNEENLRVWGETYEKQLASYLRPLTEAHWKLCQERGWKLKQISARFVILHTLAHLLINRLIFECGYSSAALRERLYVSEKTDVPMAGILIYTADGDSDGTLGGLVRMGQPDRIESVLFNALDHARWCSSDPVCSEMGKHGQGPDSCNLAACHSCCLIPETSCELFNRFLDRQVLISNSTTNNYKGFAEFSN